jgi:imidazolonepropionase-like amidohydrolase
VTTVRDVGSQYDVGPTLKFAVATGLVQGARPFVARNTICQTGGHTSDLPGMAREANGPEDLRLAVREQIKGGADLIKITTSGRRGFPELTLEEMRAAVDEAHRSGFRVACHASILPAVRTAVLAGVDTIEHCCEVDEDIIAGILRQGITVVPTALAFASIVENWDRYKHHAFHRNIPARWKTTQASVRALVAAGARIAIGSDTDEPQAPFAAVAQEARLLQDLGLKPTDAVLGATARAAEALDRAGEFGTLEAGKIADVVAVVGDPTRDVRVLESIRFVMQAGRVIRQE